MGRTVMPRRMRVSSLVLAVMAASGLAVVAPLSGPADATTCAAGTAVSNPLGPATGWTEFIRHNSNRGAESEGSVAVGGNRTGGSMTVGTHLSTAAHEPTLVVKGASASNYNLQKGSAFLGDYAPGKVNFNGGAGAGPLAANPIDFDAAFALLEQRSAAWGAAPATGTLSVGVAGGNPALILTGTNPSLNVFTVTSADVAGRHIAIDAPSGSTVLINVPEASFTLTGQMWIKKGGAWVQASDGVVKPASGAAGWPGMIWNFPAATSVDVNFGAAFAGTLLAPKAALTVGNGTGHTIGQVIAASFVSDRETHLNLVPSQPCVPTPPGGPTQSDVTITKTASHASPQGGATVTYTLLVKNLGDATATGVVATDVLPAGVTYVSSPGCGYAAGTRAVTCTIGDLAPGASVTRTITVTADPIAGAGPASHPQADHWLTPYKAELQVDLEPGQQRSVSLSCQPGDILSDGMFRVDHVDQGTGTLSDVKILRSQASPSAQETWRGAIRNQATGRAQAKAFIVCLPGRTEAAPRYTGYQDSHRHDITVHPAVVSGGGSYPAGRTSTTLTCHPGTVPIAPGYDVPSAAAVLVGSEPKGPRGWEFTLDVAAPAAVDLSLRCLYPTTSAVQGHTHELRLDHVARTVVVPAGASVTERVTCADDAKGVVGTWKVPPGVHHDGNDPQLKSRDFRLRNTTGSAQSVLIDLECLADRTSTERIGTPDPVEVTNVATVTSTSTDANPHNNSSTVTIAVQPGGVTAAATGLVRLVRGKAVVKVASAVPGKGAVKVRVGKRVVGKASVRLKAGKVVTVRVTLTKVGKRALKRAKQARVVVDPKRGKAVAKVLRVRR